jgi:hypothetical protein
VKVLCDFDGGGGGVMNLGGTNLWFNSLKNYTMTESTKQYVK